jgi:glutathione S-transferase
MLRIHGCKGWGSTVIEAVCKLLGEEYTFHEVEPWTEGPALDALRALNPLAQVPTVLDVYAAMVSRWRPGRERIREVAPRAVAAAERAEAHPVVGPVFARNFGG